MTGHTANGRGLDNLDRPRGLPLSQSRSSMAFRIGRLLVAALLLALSEMHVFYGGTLIVANLLVPLSVAATPLRSARRAARLACHSG